MAESEIVLNRHVFVSIVGPETEEKAEKYSQSGYYFPLLLIKKKKLSAKKMSLEKPPTGGGSRG